MKILVVEDNLDYAHVLEIILTPYGQVEIVGDGLDAVKMFQSALDIEDPYDLILLDIMLPGKDGLLVLKDIRDIEEELELGGSLGVKVIITTAREDEETVLAAIRTGCEGYVFKTAGKRKILDKLMELGLITRQPNGNE